VRDPAFEAIVARLCADDPEFTDRMKKLGGPPSKRRVGLDRVSFGVVESQGHSLTECG
jgi:hypothetical protein